MRDPKLNGRRVLVVGAGGFIGSRLVDKLATEQSARVTAVVRDARKAMRFASSDVVVREVDLGDRAGIADAVRGHEIVINTAHDFRTSERRNIRGVENLVDACVAAGVTRLVHTSSIVVYDDWPNGDITERSPRDGNGSEYKNAKRAAEELLSLRASSGDLSVAIIQPTIVYGPHGWIWTDQIVERLRTGTMILPEQCDGACHAVYVDDVVDALILAAAASIDGAESFIISGPGAVTWREFFEFYERALGTGSIRYAAIDEPAEQATDLVGRLKSIARNPMQVAGWRPVRRVVGSLQRAIGERAIERIRSAMMDMNRKRGPAIYHPSADDIRLYRSRGVCHIDKAKDMLGYSPAFSFADGGRRTSEYILEESSGGAREA